MISHSLMVDRGSAPTRFIILYHVMDSMESESLRLGKIPVKRSLLRQTSSQVAVEALLSVSTASDVMEEVHR